MADEEMPMTPEPEDDVAEAEEEEQQLDEEEGDAEAAADEEDGWKMIEELGHGDKFVVRMRQQLSSPELASKFVTEMTELIESRKVEDKTTVFEDFDISQNAIPHKQFEDMFSALSDSGVQVERFRAFGCPTLNDDTALLLAGWLSMVASDMAPFEMHLSDCAMQTEGFTELVKAFMENDAFPPSDPRNPDRGKLPLYLRLEGNYIDKEAIQEKVDDGTFMIMRKTDRPVYTTEHKVRFLVREDGGFAQKQGEPPNPEDAPPPKRVHDFKGKDKGKGKGKGKDKGRDSKGKGKDRGKDSYRDSYRDRDSKGKGKSNGRSSAFAALPASRAAPRGEAPWTSRDRQPVRNQDKGSSRGDRGYSSYDRNQNDRDSRGGKTRSSYDDNRSSGYNAPARDGGRDAGRGGSYPSERYSAFNRSSAASTGKGGGGRNPPPATRQAAPTVSHASRPAVKRPMERDSGASDAKRQRLPFQPTRAAAAGAGRAANPAPSRETSRPAAGGKTRDAGKGKGKGKASGGGGKLPYPWEEHWSDEYSLNYYWNSKTGDSSWEKPR